MAQEAESASSRLIKVRAGDNRYPKTRPIHTLIRISPRPWMSSKSSTVSAQTPRSSVRGSLLFFS
jgi:hypothetical protein